MLPTLNKSIIIMIMIIIIMIIIIIIMIIIIIIIMIIIIIGALGMVKKGIQNHLNTIPGEPNLQEIQKIVLTSTTHLLRKALSI